MAKISKKRFLELAEEFCVDPEQLYKDSFIGRIYTELNKPKNKWISWTGGPCPVDPNTKVDIKFQDGTIHKNEFANGYFWEHDFDTGNIIAYKVIDNQ